MWKCQPEVGDCITDYEYGYLNAPINRIAFPIIMPTGGLPESTILEA